ncbi:Na(+)/H(+) antiporter subunit B [Cyanobacterium stanieri LEGE 03274]|uniref:Na(+)/H(+) antiporter subunit B n=1 Tax=Cyanobacterium stanieri LEGE 03274 TaxID=1828756 RepID=A0ABR9V6V9_9CHRO|nr:Na(+)/H(+) antiporter subunit B [Cyanobacterium stanieri]MBE9223646.1 Na(+)/H(+) antiporter subunit B [Cyanobacterium stanieri LEGE 03274]
MKILYLLAGLALFLKMLFTSTTIAEIEELSIMETIIQDSGVANSVSGVIFRNRLYDTIFEVVVFTIAILGASFLLSNETPTQVVYQFTDQPSVVLARLGATIATLVAIELAIRGHLSPGGGFAAGVAGGTAIALVAITSPWEWLQEIYKKWQVATVEKVSVLIFIVLASITLMGGELPYGQIGSLASGGIIPILNILVALKVCLGSWAVILLFIRYRGLL